MRTKGNKIIAAILASILLLSLMPSSVFAQAATGIDLQDDAAVLPVPPEKAPVNPNEYQSSSPAPIAATPLPTGMNEYHRMTSENELKPGFHYIFVFGTNTNGSYPALSYYDSYTFGIMDDEVHAAGTGFTAWDTDSYVMNLSVSSAGDWNFTFADGSRLKLNSGKMLDPSSPGAITITSAGNDTWTVKSSSRNLAWNGTEFESPTSGSTAAVPVEIWTDYEVKEFTQITAFDQLENLSENAEFLIVIVGQDGKRHAIGYRSSSSWLLDVEPLVRGNEKVIVLEGERGVQFTSHAGRTFGTSATTELAEYFKFDYLQLSDGRQLYLPEINPDAGDTDAHTISSPPFRYPGVNSDRVTPYNNNVLIQNNTGVPGQFYLRGNGSNRWLRYDGTEYASGTFDGGERVKIEIYVNRPTNGSTVVEFQDVNGAVINSYNVSSSVTLIRQMDDITVNGVDYIFVGWSARSTYADPAARFLSKANSANLYGYQSLQQENAFREKAVGLGLLGKGDPQKPSTITLASIPEFNGTKLTLYPVYAYRGYDDAVSADYNGVRVLGVSDWKNDEPDGAPHAQNTNERWLGSIDVSIYKDGELWVSTPLYFSYHNDNAADLNIKFVWDDEVEKYGGLYPFMSRYNKDTDFPAYDQVGHFLIEGVYAKQGGSQDDLLKFSLNWMTGHGGQLDNVRGGDEVKIFVTTKYNVKYFLDGKQITDDAWKNGNFYTTDGTEKAFAPFWESAPYKASYSGSGDSRNLIDPACNDGGLKQDDIHRGDFAYFAYDLRDPKGHSIGVAESPASLLEEAVTLKSTAWSIRGADGTELATVNWESKFDVTGPLYGMGTTAYAYKDSEALDLHEADSPFTFHLHAFTLSPPDTGDHSRPALWLSLMALSLTAIGVYTGFEVKRRKCKASH